VKRIVAGPRAVHEALVAHAGDVNAVFVQEDAGRALNELAAEAGRRGVKVEERTKDELDALAKGLKHQGVVAITGAYSTSVTTSTLRFKARSGRSRTMLSRR
jgi:tRNA G18 (ribose-2'-O)-methylase SpoU